LNQGFQLPAMTHVQYGCGLSAPTEWLNFDASPTLRLQRLPVIGRLSAVRQPLFPKNVRFGDIVNGLPVPPEACRAVYSSHVLEHLSLADFRTALVNTRKILGRMGIFRLVVPDLRILAQRYAADGGDTAAVRFMTDSGLGLAQRNRGAIGLLRTWLGNSQHLWMWDYPSLCKELQTAGFTGARAAQFGDSEDPLFSAVEDKSRWEDAIAIQCYA
jgi:hypothetical protein